MSNIKISPRIRCAACPHFWPAPDVRRSLFVGRCQLFRRWLLAEQKCNGYIIDHERKKRNWEKETRI